MEAIKQWRAYRKLHHQNPDPYSEAKVDFFVRNNQRVKRCNQEPNPEIAIIIPAHNEQSFLPRTLASINTALENFRDGVEIIVVNNSSDDATAEIAQQFGAIVIVEPIKGIGRARQSGLEVIGRSVEVVFTTDADTVVPSFWIPQYLTVLQRPEVVLSYGDFRFEADNEVSTRERFLLKAYQQGVRLNRHLKNLVRIPYGVSNNLAFRKAAMDEIGGYSVQLSCGEDLDIMLRMSRIGIITKCEGQPVITSARRVLKEKLGRGFLQVGFDQLRHYINRRVPQDRNYEDYRI